MKVLVTYFSQTGNTGKIAKAICDEASQSNDCEMKKIEEVNADSFNEYEIVFIGAPCHAGDIAGAVKDVLGNLPGSGKFKVAGFLTHASAAYEKQGFEKCLTTFESSCKDKGIDYMGCFDCQGYLNEAIHDMVKKAQNASDEDWKKSVEQMSGHPDSDDEAKAKDFAKGVLS